MERKDNPLDRCQLKFSNDDKGLFHGYASVFNSVDKVGDTIVPGAYAKSLSSPTYPKMFVNHDHRQVPIGDWFKMVEDEQGLFVEGKIDLNHKDGPTVHSAMKRGAMDGLSIGFTMGADDYESKDGGRLIKSMNLMEVSVVNFPCEGQATVTAVKSDILALKNLSDCENFLRDACGLSRSMARVLISQIKGLTRCDAEAELIRQIEENKKQAHSALKDAFSSARLTLNRLKDL